MSSFVPRALLKYSPLHSYSPRADNLATRPLLSVQNCFQCITTTFTAVSRRPGHHWSAQSHARNALTLRRGAQKRSIRRSGNQSRGRSDSYGYALRTYGSHHYAASFTQAIIISKSIIALALLAASSTTALLDVHKDSPRLRRRLGKGKSGKGGKGKYYGKSKGGWEDEDEESDEDDCSCDAVYEELEACKENSEACQDELNQCSEQIQDEQKKCDAKTDELKDLIGQLTEELAACEATSEEKINELQTIINKLESELKDCNGDKDQITIKLQNCEKSQGESRETIVKLETELMACWSGTSSKRASTPRPSTSTRQRSRPSGRSSPRPPSMP